MPPKINIDWEPWKDLITERMQSGVRYPVLHEELAQKGLHVHPRALATQIKRWNIGKYRRPVSKKGELDERVRVLIAFSFHILRLSDKDACEYLAKEGFDITTFTYARLRKKLGLIKRLPVEAHSEAESAIADLLREEFADTNVEQLNREHLYAYLRAKYNIVGRDRIFKIAKLLDPEGPDRRRSRKPIDAGQKPPLPVGAVAEPQPDLATSDALDPRLISTE